MGGGDVGGLGRHKLWKEKGREGRLARGIRQGLESGASVGRAGRQAGWTGLAGVGMGQLGNAWCVAQWREEARCYVTIESMQAAPHRPTSLMPPSASGRGCRITCSPALTWVRRLGAPSSPPVHISTALYYIQAVGALPVQNYAAVPRHRKTGHVHAFKIIEVRKKCMFLPNLPDLIDQTVLDGRLLGGRLPKTYVVI